MAAVTASLQSDRKLAKLASERRSLLALNLSFRGQDMRKMDSIFGWCDSYLQILRLKHDVWSELATTTVVSGQKNPVFDPVSIRLSKLRSEPSDFPSDASDELSIAGGTDYPLLIKAFHWKKRGDPELMGSFETTLSELEQRHKAFATHADPLGSSVAIDAIALKLIDPVLAADPKKGRSYQHSGLVLLPKFEVVLKVDKRKSKRRTMGEALSSQSMFALPSMAAEVAAAAK